MLAEITIRTHRASTRVSEVLVFNPQLDSIRVGSPHLCRDGPLVLGYGFDLSIDKVVLAAFEGSRARHAAEIAAFEKSRKG